MAFAQSYLVKFKALPRLLHLIYNSLSFYRTKRDINSLWKMFCAFVCACLISAEEAAIR